MKRRVVCTKGTPEQFMDALEDRIQQLSQISESEDVFYDDEDEYFDDEEYYG